jgi:hypothetical protein
MLTRTAERVLWVASAIILTVMTFDVRRGRFAQRQVSAMAAIPAAPPAMRLIAADSLEEALTVLTENDVFRPSTAAVPASVPVTTVAPLPAAPRPPLVVRGLLGGPPWDAVLDGIPGRTGSVVVRAGDVIGALRVRAITRDSVIVESADTVWRLSLRRP